MSDMKKYKNSEHEAARSPERQEQSLPTCPLYDEMDWADYVLGKLDPERSRIMQVHSRQCSSCAEQLAEWNHILLPLPEQHESKTRTNGAQGWETAVEQVEEGYYPSKEIKQKLLEQFAHWKSRTRSKVRRFRDRSDKAKASQRRKIGAWSAAVMAASIAFLLISGLFEVKPNSPPVEVEPLLSFIEAREPDAVRVIRAPDSRLSTLIPAVDQGWGMIWMAVNADEAVMLVEGLSFNDQAEYQVWAVSGNNHESLGFFKQSGSIAHVHIRNAALKSATNISYSEEPKGGSLRPTSQKTVLYVLP